MPLTLLRWSGPRPRCGEWRVPSVTSFLNTQIGVLMEEQKGYSAVFNRLTSERQNVLDYAKGL